MQNFDVLVMMGNTTDDQFVKYPQEINGKCTEKTLTKYIESHIMGY